jgi:hypothetical protein
LSLVNLKLGLTAGFQIYIQACIRVCVFRKCFGKCWNVVKWTKSFPILSKTLQFAKPPAISDGTGSVNFDAAFEGGMYLLGQADLNSLPTIGTFYDVNLQRTTIYSCNSNCNPSDAPDTRSLNVLPFVSFDPRFNNAASVVQVKYVPQEVRLPASSLLQAQIFRESYPDANHFTISPASVLPSASAPIVFNGCSQLLLTSPGLLPSQDVLLGVPCATKLEVSTGSSVSLTGLAANYANNRVEVTGPVREVSVSGIASSFSIETSRVSDNAAFNVFLPTDTPMLSVAGLPDAKGSYSILSVTEGTQLYVNGQNMDDDFFVALDNVLGFVSLDGGEGLNSIKANGQTVPGGSSLAATSSSLSLRQGGSTKALRLSNVQARTLKMTGLDNEKSDVSIISPENDAIVSLTCQGTPLSTMVTKVTGTSAQADVRIYLTGGGVHNVTISSFSSLSKWYGNVHIVGDDGPNQVDTVILDGAEDSRLLSYTVRDGTVSVCDINEITHCNSVFFSGLEAMVLRVPQSNYASLIILDPFFIC